MLLLNSHNVILLSPFATCAEKSLMLLHTKSKVNFRHALLEFARLTSCTYFASFPFF